MGVFDHIFAALARAGQRSSRVMIDSTHLKAHRTAASLLKKGMFPVEVTERTGDGGIDGKGIARINGFISFHVLFQCKRYKGSVSADEIRDFRGAMVGRADKGLFITTGSFTSAATKEATRDGAPSIDLVDGDELAGKLKESGLSVKTELVEKVSVDFEWFSGLWHINMLPTPPDKPL